MEMKDIDLTKCNNCRAWVRYRYDRVYEGTGRIEKVTEEGGEVRMRFVADEDGYLITMWEDGKICEHIMDFEIVPRDPETYQDWQVGDVIWDTHESGDNGRIIFRSGDFVAADIDGCRCYTCGELYDDGYRLFLTGIEQKIIEDKIIEKKKREYEPQDGDIVAWKDKEGDGRSALSICREKNWSYMTLFTNGTCCVNKATLSMNIIRPATDEEKKRLFDAMAKQGKRWNAEKKVVEDIPKPYEFKKGEPVLVRNHDYELWSLFAYHEQAGDKHIVKTCVCTVLQSQCIPYNERTMHLLGTTEDYEEE